jgi:hypothetical protein
MSAEAVQAEDVLDDTAPPAPGGRRTRPGMGPTRWPLLVGGAALLVLFHGARMSALGADGLNADIGIQHFLARSTAQGAIPLIDFEHGWNTASWYFSAALLRLAGGNPSTWVFLWAIAFGPLLAGLLLLVAGWRLRLPAVWTAALLGAWVSTIHLPHSKYAVAMAWMLVLLPVGVGRRRGAAVALRVGLTATVFWFHAELAVLLAAGTAMYDLFGARDSVPVVRVQRLVAVGAGLVLGLGTQVAVYAALGLPAAETLRQVLIGQTGVYDLQFGYPLGNPQTFRVLVYPATLILPFVPALWRRLSDPTRYVAFLHLSQALIGIRRPGDGHVGSAATLLALLAVLVVHDLLTDPPPGLARPSGARSVLLAGAGLLLGGAWFAVAVAAGFRVPSFLAIVALSAVCLLGVAAARGGERPWASAGAVLAAVALLATSLAGRTATRVAQDAGEEQAEAIAAVAGAEVARCVPDGRAWVVPSPLMLYATLDLENPTPFVLFWYTFEAELDRVRGMVDAGQIPAIVQPYGWPESMTTIVGFLEDRYELCAEVAVPQTGNLVRVWTYAG